MLVGEQPADREDVEGLPFVGPAGRLLTRALHDADIDSGLTYETNAVKHFKFTQTGKRRIHQKLPHNLCWARHFALPLIAVS
jgi:DNA polymerase